MTKVTTDTLPKGIAGFHTRSAEEARALQLLDPDNMEALGLEWSTSRQVVAMVFRACWANSLYMDKINVLGRALGALHGEADLSKTVTQMVRAGILRSRQSGGRRLYEVNY